jgi:hypothetical protein
MNNMENWKDIPGYEGLYQVSDLGNVKTLEKIIPHLGSYRIQKEKILSPGITKGYKNVSLTKDKMKTTFKVHKLVAMVFMNHIPNGMVDLIDHLDENKLNNRLSNLSIKDNRGNINKYHLAKSTKSSKYRGVSLHKCGKWITRIRNGKKREYLGLFDTEEQASHIYEKRLKEINKLK